MGLKRPRSLTGLALERIFGCEFWTRSSADQIGKSLLGSVAVTVLFIVTKRI